MESHEWSGPYRHQFEPYYQFSASTNSSEDSDSSPSLGASCVKTRPFPAKTSTTLQPMLPPCRVCGERASGFHYGVNTCEACKVSYLVICSEESELAIITSLESFLHQNTKCVFENGYTSN